MVTCKNIELKTAIVLDQVLFRSTPIKFFPIDKDGFSPLHHAVCNGPFEVVKLLANGANVNIRDNNGLTPLYHAAEEGKLEIVKCLINFGAWVDLKDTVNNYAPLHAAAEEGHKDVVKLLIEKGANVNICNKDLESPLHIAVENKNLEIVKYLVESGATIDIKDKYDETPLHVAANQNQLEVVKYLVENGAKIDPKNKHNHTPYYLAVKNDCQNVAEFLTKIKKRKANDEPMEIFNSKDPCVLCFEPRNGLYVLLPCGHTSLCETCCIKITCKENNSKCPTCRKSINAYNKIFFQKPE